MDWLSSDTEAREGGAKVALYGHQVFSRQKKSFIGHRFNRDDLKLAESAEAGLFCCSDTRGHAAFAHSFQPRV